MTRNGKGILRRDRHQSGGNSSLLVIVNSNGNYWDWHIVDETVLVALEHYGMPYRLLDLASERLDAATLSACAGIILAQDHVAGSLTESEGTLISEAVKNGAGFVSFDNDLRCFHAPLLEMFGFGAINPNPFATNLIRIPETGHYITALQVPGEYHTFDRMVTATIAESWRNDVVVLAEGILGKDQLVYIRHLSPWSAFEPRNYPVVFGARWGKGKAVQFILNPRVWRNAFFGHARGIDDLFWRSILWSVRKPFAANIIPPFLTLSVDDCSGRADFKYADIACQHKFIPLFALFLKTVPECLFPKVKAGIQSGKVQFTSHALDYYNLSAFHFGRGECTTEELKERFAFDDSWWRKVGASPGETIRFHWGEWGVNALPFCKERGRVFFCPALQTGLHKADMCMLDGYWPYNVQTCYYDYLPDDHDFFAFGSFVSRHQEDFLTGCTPNLRESERVDVEKAAASAARQIRHGLRGCFSAEIVTHEQKFDGVKLEEWDTILGKANKQTQAFETIFASHDHIANYLKGKDSIWIRESHVEGGQVRCALAGTTKVSLCLSVFHDEEDSVRREYRSVDPFTSLEQVGV